MKIQTILTTKGADVITVRADQTLREAAALLVEHNIGALVAVDERGRPAGILSERDVVRAAARWGEAMFAQPAAEAMTKRVVVGRPQDDVHAVMQTMTVGRFRHLPVVDGDKLIGIVSIGDVVKAQLDQYQGEVDTLETQIIG